MDWQRYYYDYQNSYAKTFLLKLLGRRKKVLEIGCGDGGVIEAFAKYALKAVGVDTIKLNRLGHKAKYIRADIFDKEKRHLYEDKYDLIILRDVIEHIEDKKELLNICNELLTPNGSIFISFPPYYSPFGAHQHTFSKSFIGKLPFTQLLPDKLYLKFVQAFERGNEPAIRTAKELIRSKTTINGLAKVIRESVFEITGESYYIVSPAHSIKFKLGIVKCNWLSWIPIMRELIPAVYLVARRS